MPIGPRPVRDCGFRPKFLRGPGGGGSRQARAARPRRRARCRRSRPSECGGLPPLVRIQTRPSGLLASLQSGPRPLDQPKTFGSTAGRLRGFRALRPGFLRGPGGGRRQARAARRCAVDDAEEAAGERDGLRRSFEFTLAPAGVTRRPTPLPPPHVAPFDPGAISAPLRRAACPATPATFARTRRHTPAGKSGASSCR